ITTDIIVGFPGETDEDFQRTLEVVEASRFASAFTCQYSIRPGPPAATMEDPLPKVGVHERVERPTARQDRITHEEHLALESHAVEIRVAEGEGTRDARTDRLSGRSRDHRLVHFSLPEEITDAERPRPGDLVTATVTRAAPHYLIADSACGLTSGTWPDAERCSVRRTRAGDAWEAGQLGLDAGSCGTGGGAAPSGRVTLGMPTLRAR